MGSEEPGGDPVAFLLACVVVVHDGVVHNLLANSIVTVEVGGETFEARARVTGGAERDRLFAQRAVSNQNFGEYQKRTTRVIPVVVPERLGIG